MYHFYLTDKNFKNMKNLQISIIGDGLTGLVTALSMANLNLKVDVYWRKNEKKKQYKR